MTEAQLLDKLLAKCLKGNEAAYQKLYHMFYGFLFSIAKRYARDGDEAHDIVHQAFVRICKNLSQFKGNGSFKSWIKRIVLNESINYFNRINKGNKIFYQDDMSYYDGYEAVVVSEESVLAKLNYDDLYQLVLELPPAYKAVFSMYAIDGFKHKEIAEALGIEISTSKSNLSRAKALLVDKLEKAGISKKKKLKIKAGNG